MSSIDSKLQSLKFLPGFHRESTQYAEEGKWFDKLSDKDKLNYRQLPDISDQDSLKIMEDPKNLRRMPSDSVNAKLV